jgi:hypothetical protein
MGKCCVCTIGLIWVYVRGGRIVFWGSCSTLFIPGKTRWTTGPSPSLARRWSRKRSHLSTADFPASCLIIRRSTDQSQVQIRHKCRRPRQRTHPGRTSVFAVRLRRSASPPATCERVAGPTTFREHSSSAALPDPYPSEGRRRLLMTRSSSGEAAG